MPGRKFLYRRLWYLKKRNNKKLRLYICLSVITVFFTFFIYFAEKNALPNIADASRYQAEVLLGPIIDNEVMRHINENAKYEDYVTVDKDRNGRIISVTTDVSKLNRLTEEVKSAVSARMSQMENEFVSVPLRVIFTRSAIMSAGSGINIMVKPSDRVEAEYISDITPFGSDGARHCIYLQIKVKVDLSFSFLMKKSIEVVSTVPLTEMLFERNLAPAFLERINAPVLE